MITGSTDGIGKFTAQKVARDGHRVLVHGRSREKVEAVVATLRRSGGTAEGFVADLSSLAEVRSLGAAVLSYLEDAPLHGLLCNAGTFDGDYTGKRLATVDGNEYSLAVNVLAPFLLISLLLQTVRASGAGRVLVTSSISMGSADALDDLQCLARWSAHRAYSLSKLCDAMLIMELHERYGGSPQKDLSFLTMDPGTVNTKMLEAGWGRCGIPVTSATRSYELLCTKEYEGRSGEIIGAWPDREVSDHKKRAKLWDDLVRLTGAVYPPPLSS
mmetsp:Transcript_20918/g.67387  ORF Transcript_20918/g.67387 Transcript_20918/m.67387 type:complete len:272 (+) Transcript_20918:214-1029(+)